MTRRIEFTVVLGIDVTKEFDFQFELYKWYLQEVHGDDNDKDYFELVSFMDEEGFDKEHIEKNGLEDIDCSILDKLVDRYNKTYPSPVDLFLQVDTEDCEMVLVLGRKLLNLDLRYGLVETAPLLDIDEKNSVFSSLEALSRIHDFKRGIEYIGYGDADWQ